MAGDQFAALRCESVSAINTVGDGITCACAVLFG